MNLERQWQEVAPGVRRCDILTYETLAEARAKAHDGSWHIVPLVVKGEGPRPYWLPVSRRIGGRLIEAGYEYA